jgi:hypothetical protein
MSPILLKKRNQPDLCVEAKESRKELFYSFALNMGSGIGCPFKESTDMIVERGGAALFGHAGRVLGYTAGPR